jgi:hypothetical protein
MSSIDHRDAEVQTHFTAMKKASDDGTKFKIAEQLAKMYEKSDDYTYGVYFSIIRFLQERTSSYLNPMTKKIKK